MPRSHIRFLKNLYIVETGELFVIQIPAGGKKKGRGKGMMGRAGIGFTLEELKIHLNGVWGQRLMVRAGPVPAGVPMLPLRLSCPTTSPGLSLMCGVRLG